MQALDDLIDRAKQTRSEDDMEALQNRDYDKMKDPSLLRFLVDSRGEDISNRQLRDDLMTMLIAGHETTAAVLTWTLFSLMQHPRVAEKLRAEVDEVLGDRMPTLEDIKKLNYTRSCLAEVRPLSCTPSLLLPAIPHVFSCTPACLPFCMCSPACLPSRMCSPARLPSHMCSPVRLPSHMCSPARLPSSAQSLRMFPQPPFLIRRALKDLTLPGGLTNLDEIPLNKGADIFISVWNLHRSPTLWENPDEFRPERFAERREAPKEWADKWNGFDPAASPGALYPNETMGDFAFLPFGGGSRKCVGDQVTPPPLFRREAERAPSCVPDRAQPCAAVLPSPARQLCSCCTVLAAERCSVSGRSSPCSRPRCACRCS